MMHNLLTFQAIHFHVSLNTRSFDIFLNGARLLLRLVDYIFDRLTHNFRLHSSHNKI